MIGQAFLSVVHPTEWDTLHLKNVPIVLQGTYRYSIIAFIPASLAPSTKGNAHDKRRPTPVEHLSIRTYTLIFMGLSPPSQNVEGANIISYGFPERSQPFRSCNHKCKERWE